MSNEKRPLKVFLCHAHADKSKARELYNDLKRRGVQPWLDAEDLIPGQDWKVEIPKELENSDAIIIFLSKVSVGKEGFIQKEFKFARDKALEMPEGRIFLIPARLEECDVPRSLSDYHWVDLFDEGGHDKLLKSLDQRAAQLNCAKIVHPQKPEEHPRKLKNEYVIAIIAAAIITAGIFGFLWTSSYPTPTSPSITATLTTLPTPVLPSATMISGTKAPSATFTAIHPDKTPDPFDLIDAKGVTMRLIPAGEFTMGSSADAAMFECYKFRSDCNRNDFVVEEPVHKVTLAVYYMDVYEVTNALYKACVDARMCQPPVETKSATRDSYYGNPEFDNFPVIYVDWIMAKTYCEWRGARLPTEEEWEKAARSTDGRIYPWGNDFSESSANFCDKNCPMDYANKKYDDGQVDTAPVGSYESGKSPYRLYDMAGNVWEWTADWYAAYSGGDPTANTYLGQKYRTIRGGSWDDSKGYELRVSNRGVKNPIGTANLVGFRCARDTKP